MGPDLSFAERRRAARMATTQAAPIALVPLPSPTPAAPRTKRQEPPPKPVAPQRPPHVCRSESITREALAARAGQEVGAGREAELVRRYQAGDRHAGEVLLRVHAKSIAGCARKHGRGRHDLSGEDLLSEAQIGFLEGVCRFDPAEHGLMIAHALCSAKRRVLSAKVRAGSTIRVPAHARKRLREGRGDECAQRAGCALAPRRLDATLGNADSETLHELLADAGSEDAEVIAAEREWKAVTAEMLGEAMAALPEKFSIVLRRRAMGETVEAIAQSMDMSRDRVREIEELAKKKARRALGKIGRLRLAEAE